MNAKNSIGSASNSNSAGKSGYFSMVFVAMLVVFAFGVSFAVEGPTFDSAVTADTNGDGTVDQITIGFNEAVSIFDRNSRDGLASITLDDGCSISNAKYGSTSTDTLILRLNGCDGGTDLTPTVTYTEVASCTTIGAICDIGGTQMLDAEDIISSDGAAPVFTLISTDDDGTNITEITLTFSELVYITDANAGDGLASITLSDECIISNLAYGDTDTTVLTLHLEDCAPGVDLIPTVTYTAVDDCAEDGAICDSAEGIQMATLPTVAFTVVAGDVNLADGAYISTANQMFEVEFKNFEVSTGRIMLNGIGYRMACDAGDSGFCEIDKGRLAANKEYTYSVVLKNTSGSTISTQERTFTSDRVNPVLSYARENTRNKGTVAEGDFYAKVNYVEKNVDPDNVVINFDGDPYDMACTGTSDTKGYCEIEGVDLGGPYDSGTYTYDISMTDLAGNEKTSPQRTVILDNTDPTFTMQYYSDSRLTDSMGDSPVLEAGTYYIKIISSEALAGTPTITIEAEGSANDVTNAATTRISGNNYKYTRIIASDADAEGIVLEDVSITGTDKSGNEATDNPTNEGDAAAFTDTTAPTITTVTADDYTVNSGATIGVTSDGDDSSNAGLAECAAVWSTADTYGEGDETNLGDLGTTCDGDITVPEGDGTFYIIVVPVDVAGNSNSDSSSAVTVNSAAPTVVLSDDQSDAVVSAGDVVAITATFTSTVGIDEVPPPEITIGDDVVGDAMTISTNLIWTYDWTVPAGDGAFAVSIEATDESGNPNAPATGRTSYNIVRESLDLGTAGNFVILSKSGITNVPTSDITGNIGTSPITGASITGLDCAEVTGNVYTVNAAGPACRIVAPGALTTAVSDMETAYTNAAGRTDPTDTNLGAGEIGGLVIVPGLHKWTTGVTISNDVTLNGSADDVWIFQISGTLGISNGKHVHLTGGALAKNVFWQVSGTTTLGTTSIFEGNILDATLIAIQTGATLHGRALAQTAVTLDQNTISLPEVIADPNPPTITTVTLDDYTVKNGATIAVTSNGADDVGVTECHAWWSTDTSYGGDVDLGDLGADCDGSITVPAGAGTFYVIVRPVDAAGNSNWAASSAVTVDNTAPTFTMQYYSDSGLTTSLGDNPVLKAGTYYIKITSSEVLAGTPTVTIAAEGSANDVTSAATTAVSGNDYKYTRVIASDVLAVGTVAEDLSVTGTDISANTATNANPTNEGTKAAKTDTVVPTITTVTANDYTVVNGATITVTSNGADVGGMANCNAIWSTSATYGAGTETALGDLGTDCDGDITVPAGAGTFYIISRPVDTAGNSNWAASTAVTVDNTAPAGGSVTYTNGYYTTASVGVTYTTGTDGGSGLNTATGVVQSQSATLTDGSCGGYGAFGTIATEFDGSYTDVGVVTGNCYKYQYVISDNSGNTATYTSANVAKVDTVAPTVVLDDDHADLTVRDADTVVITADFSEYMSTHTISIDYSDGACPDVSGAAFTGGANDVWTYSWNVTAACDGTATVTVAGADLAGNAYAGANVVYTIDNTAPSFVDTLDVDAGPVKTDTIQIAITDAASGFYGYSADATCDGADTINQAFATGVSFDITGDHTDYLCVKATDTAGNIGYETVGQLNTDNTAPTVAVTMGSAALKVGQTTLVTFTFSEAPTGFTGADVTVGTGTIGAIDATNPLIQTATYTPTDDVEVGTNVISVGTAWTDAATNAPLAGDDSPNYAVDTKEPTLVITTVPTSPSATKASLVYTFQFSEDVTGFTVADITLNFNGGGAGTVDGATFGTTDANTYTLTLDAGQDAIDLAALTTGQTIVASVDMTALTDIATNAGLGATPNTWTYVP